MRGEKEGGQGGWMKTDRGRHGGRAQRGVCPSPRVRVRTEKEREKMKVVISFLLVSAHEHTWP